ncbi:MAG TPA: hypothetical protein VK843_06765 [Planctomycetota bacterium]|nr:hypothetical protein [Planctomycetota bacterium]
MRRFHRALGMVLVLPLVLWVLTGLLFHVKLRYGEAYEALAVPRAAQPDWSLARISPASVLSSGLAEAPLVLGVHPSGSLVYFGKLAGQPVAVDASTGEAIAPASTETARAWVAAALSASPHLQRYGSELSAETSTSRSARTGTDDPVLVLHYSGAKTVRVDRITGEIAQTGALNDFIDASYRVHYLQWTPWKWANIALEILSIPLVLILAATGLRMALARRSR